MYNLTVQCMWCVQFSWQWVWPSFSACHISFCTGTGTLCYTGSGTATLHVHGQYIYPTAIKVFVATCTIHEYTTVYCTCEYCSTSFIHLSLGGRLDSLFRDSCSVH